MKAFKHSIFAFSLASLIAGAASAADTSGYAKIIQTKAWTADDFHVYTEDIAAGRHTCNGGGTEFRLSASQGEIFRTLTAAQLSGKTVRLQYSCSGGAAWVSGLRML